MYNDLPLTIRSEQTDREREDPAASVLWLHSLVAFPSICPQSDANAIGREQVFEEGKSEIEPQTAPRVLHYSTRLQLWGIKD